MRRIAFLSALFVVPAPAWTATEPANRCANAPMLAEPWTSWRQSGSVIAAGEIASAPRLTLGKPAIVTLRPATQVQFPAKPEALARSQGGLLAVSMKRPTRVGVALSAPAQIDVVTGQNAVSAVDTDVGPDCSEILAIHWFDLPEGLHLVQISGAKARFIRIMVADAAANQP